MRKILGLLISVLILSGCSIKRIDILDFAHIVDTMSKLNHNNLSNYDGLGYKLYLPNDIKVIENGTYNLRLKNDNNDIYLYIDIISYYHKVEKEYEIKNDIFYSSVINSTDGSGYIEITEKNDKYFVEIIYNYAKIEMYTNKNNLKNSIIDSIYILNGIKFNDIIINKLISESLLTSSTETFNIFETEMKREEYLDFIKEDDKYDDVNNELPDEDNINNSTDDIDDDENQLISDD